MSKNKGGSPFDDFRFMLDEIDGNNRGNSLNKYNKGSFLDNFFGATTRLRIKESIAIMARSFKEIDSLRYEAENAKSDLSNTLSFGIFGKSKKDKQIESLLRISELQSEIIMQQQMQMQEIIKLASKSIINNLYMYKQLNDVMENKFRDVDGNIIKLSKQQQELVRSIVPDGALRHKLLGMLVVKPVSYIAEKISKNKD